MKCWWFGFAYHESSVFTIALTPHPLSQQFGQTQCLYIDVHTHVLLYQTLPIFSLSLADKMHVPFAQSAWSSSSSQNEPKLRSD